LAGCLTGLLAWLLIGHQQASTDGRDADQVAGQPAGSPEATAWPYIDWTRADALVGRNARVGGRIVNVGRAGRVHFLDFDPERRRDVFKAVVFQEDLDRFPADLSDLYGGRTVIIRGAVASYRGAPQIVVRSPDQVQIVGELPGRAGDGRLPAGADRDLQFTVASFNLRNFFDAHDDPYREDESTRPKSAEDQRRLAAVMRELDADLFALQEVEKEGHLRQFVDEHLASLAYRNIVHVAGNDPRGSDLALLSRFDVESVTSYRHLRLPGGPGTLRRFSRDLLRVRVIPPAAEPLEVWVVHLRSNRDAEAEAHEQRLAEARAIRQLLDRCLGAVPDSRLLLCGDFNDTADSLVLRTILGDGPTALRGLWNDVPPEMRATYNRRPYRDMIDYILASPALAARYVPYSYTIRDGSLSASGSDHNPVTARFWWRRR
jgi:endonuclease/exonuclease/phosphatase family metal-dependent hydrolase